MWLHEFEGTVEGFAGHVFAVLGWLVEVTYIECGCLNRRTGACRSSTSIPLENGEERGEIYMRLKNCSPLFSLDPDVWGERVLGNRDFFTDREYRSLPLYREVLLPGGIQHELGMVIPDGEWLLVLGFFRTEARPYTERERQLLEVVRPHLGRVFRLAQLRAWESASPAEKIRLIHPQLTARQRQVLAGICEGMGNRELSDALGISLESVRTHRKAAFARLGVRTPVEAVMSVAGSGAAGLPLPMPDGNRGWSWSPGRRLRGAP